MTRSSGLRRGALAAFAAVALSAAPAWTAAAAADPDCGDAPLIVFAAASMTDAIGEFATRFEAETGCPVTVSFAGSSTLARQIAEGAPAGVFVSANRDWVSWLTENAPDRLADDPVIVARNGLVVAGNGETAASDALGNILSSRFAMGDPAHVPAGIYAAAALETLGIWQEIKDNAVYTENVRVALALAARGDVGAAIVYSTDARMEPELKVLYSFTADTHPEIAYEAVLLSGGGEVGAAFLESLEEQPGQEVLGKYGFLPGRELND